MIKKGYVDTSDGQIHYRAEPSGSGPPLLLFHMTASTSESYESLMTALAGDVPTIAIDTPGYGESFKPTAEASMEYIGKIVLEALDGLGVDRFHTFGHHTGASIALELACAAPDRVISATLNGVASNGVEEGLEMIRQYVYPNPVAPLGEHMLRGWSRITMGLETKGLEVPDELLQRELVAFLKAGEDWGWGYRAVFTYNVPEKMKEVTPGQFFLVAGEHDGIMPWHMREVERCPEFPSYIAPGYGVFYSELAPQDLAPRLIEFMRGAEG